MEVFSGTLPGMSKPAPSGKSEPSPFDKMRELASRVMSVPKAEIDRREKHWRKKRETTALKARKAAR